MKYLTLSLLLSVSLGLKILLDRKISHFPKRTLDYLSHDEVITKNKVYKNLSFGYDNFIASATWLRMLQEASHSKHEGNRASLEFDLIDATTQNDPRYYPIYFFGASFLSIFKEDKPGAYHILKKWTTYFPSYWYSHFNFGFHCFHEMQKYDEGQKAIFKAASLPNSPDWLHSLGVRILNKRESTMITMMKTIELYKQVPSYDGKLRLYVKIRALNQKNQLEQLEAKRNAFREKNKKWPSTLREIQFYPLETRELAFRTNLDQIPEIKNLLRERFKFHYNEKDGSLTPELDLSKQLGLKNT